jgi:hypothetical protein
MLQMYVLECPTKLSEYLHLVEFEYNNFDHTYLKMSPFEVMYGMKCQTPISWYIPLDHIILGQDMLKEMETIVQK